MGALNIAFHLVSCLLALLAAALLIWVNKERKHSNRLLAIILFFFALQNIMLILLFSRLMLNVPWLLRVVAPTTFLIAPASFIYIRSILKDELKFKKTDRLLLIPAILVLINFIPYYFLPQKEKIELLFNNFYNNTQRPDAGNGILPGTIYYILRICWSAIFLFLNFRLIYHFKKRNTTEMVLKNKTLLNWLFTFNCLLTTVLGVTILKTFIPPIKNTQFTVADIILGVTTLFICLYLFVRPQLLYGVYQPLPEFNKASGIQIKPFQPASSNQIDTISSPEITSTKSSNESYELAEQYRYKYLIEGLFKEKKSFLMEDYSLDHLVRDINVPRHVVSSFINREYGMGFREFLNRYRMNYLKENIKNPDWKLFTIEAIAAECGFSSRTTFIKNFKEITGQTPSEYIKKARRDDPDI